MTKVPVLKSILVLGLMAGGFLVSPHAQTVPSDQRIRIEGSGFVTNEGEAFLVKGIHYGPWRPGTGPAKGYPYPANDLIDDDFTLIRQTHANTVLIFDPPARVLDLADQHGLKVLYCFSLDWWTLGGPQQASIRRDIAETVESLHNKPALMGWLLGNEIPLEALHQRGDETLTQGLHDLYAAVKAADPWHPVSFANTVMGKHLDVGFLDFISFNLYPTWPPEVVAHGYGPYVSEVLRPLAANKPLLLSEFGVNSIEAGQDGQARLLRESWQGLVEAGEAGGVVFEFADEWWKNYNNPIRPGNWWFREPSPDDELKHDADPEESYGIVTSDREPKPAYATVATMFAEPSPVFARQLASVVVSGLVLLAIGLWLWSSQARLRHEPRRAQSAAARTEEGAGLAARTPSRP